MAPKKNFKILIEIGYNLSLLTYLGLLFIGNIIFYIFIYKLIEKYIFKSNIILIIAVILGIYSGGISVYRSIYKIKKDKK